LACVNNTGATEAARQGVRTAPVAGLLWRYALRMATNQDALLARLDQLIADGMSVEQMGTGSGKVDSRSFNAWRVRALSVLERTVGVSDAYYRSFVERCTRTWRTDASAGVAIIESFRGDIAAGYLTRYGDLVAASILSDFLEMAEHLLTQGYKDPAASLIGAVLEDGLRKVAGNAGIPVTSGDGLDSLNGKCADAGIYGPLQKSQVNSVRIVRNEADHGHFEEYAAADVGAALETVRNLLAAQLG